MKKLLCATILSGVISLSATAAIAAGGKGHKDPDSLLIKASYSLPNDDGDEFRQTLHEADQENADLKQRIMLDHADLYDLLTADQFDSKAFLSKEQEVLKLQDQMRENRDEAFADAASQLSPDERKTYADALRTDHITAERHHHKKQASATSSSSDDSSTTVSQ